MTRNRRAAISAAVIVSFALAANFATPSSAAAQYGGSSMGNNQPAASQQPNLPSNAAANSTSSSSSSQKTGARAAIAKALNDAQDLANKKDLQGALAKIKEADAFTDKSPYEEYVVARTLGYVDIQLQDMAGATAAYNRALASNGVPADSLVQTLKIVMQLNVQQKDYGKAIAAGEQLSKLGQADTTTTTLLAQLYYLNGDYTNAMRVARAGIDASGGKPDDRLLTVLEESQIKTGDQAGARKTQEMLAKIPGSSANLGAMIGEAERKAQNHHQLLQLNRLRLMAGAMSAQDFVIGVQLALEARFFREAHDLIDQGAGAGASQVQKFAGQARSGLSAEEKSLPALEHAATSSSTGEIDITLGETYMTYGRLPEAEAAIQRGLAKGGVKNSADAEVTLGIVFMKEGKKDDALKAFAKAAETPSEEPIAHAWTTFVQHGS